MTLQSPWPCVLFVYTLHGMAIKLEQKLLQYFLKYVAIADVRMLSTWHGYQIGTEAAPRSVELCNYSRRAHAFHMAGLSDWRRNCCEIR